jgi:chromosome partitioning protein
MRKIAMLNQKGGVGKTTSVVNIAAALAKSGAKVVVADFDPQAHLTIHLGVEPDSVQSGVYEVLSNSADFDQSLIEVRSNLFLLGANINLVGAESELISVVGREIIFREAVSKSQHNFDFMIVDCPPSLSLLTLNALAACDEVIIPLQPHFLALQGLGKLLQTVTLVSRRINPKLKVSGALLCMFDPRVSLSEEVKNDIDKFFENARGTDCPWNNAEVIPVLVRRNIKLAEAPSYGKTVFEYEPECNGSKDYQLIAEFLLRGSLPKQQAVQHQPQTYHPTPLQQVQPPIQIQPIPPSSTPQPQQQFQPNQIIGQ